MIADLGYPMLGVGLDDHGAFIERAYFVTPKAMAIIALRRNLDDLPPDHEYTSQMKSPVKPAPSTM